MPNTCIFPICRGKKEKRSLFSFPKSVQIRQLWVDEVRRAKRSPNWQPTPWSKVCEDHFTPQDIIGRRLRRTAVPNHVVEQSSTSAAGMDLPLAADQRFDHNHNTATAEIQLPPECPTSGFLDHDYCCLVQSPQAGGMQPASLPPSLDCTVARMDVPLAAERPDHPPTATVEIQQPLECPTSSVIDHGYCRSVQPPTMAAAASTMTIDAVLAEKDLQIKRLTCELEKRNKMLSQLFNEDQVEFLERRLVPTWLSANHKWSAKTVSNCLALRLAVGCDGYEFLRKEMNYPVPSYRTIARRLEGLQYAPGIQFDMLDLVADKLKSLPSHAQMVVLKLDEMSIASRLQYDPATKSVLGTVTMPPTPDKMAKKLLTCMLGCLTVHYKQTIAYHFTGSSVTGTDLWDFVLSVIMACGERRIRVVAVCTDMDASNQAMWRAAGLKGGEAMDKSFIQHPFYSGSYLFFSPDTPHLIKAMKTALCNHSFQLPASVVQKNFLPSNMVTLRPIEKVINIQEGSPEKLVPGLASSAISNKNSFEKMKVAPACKVYSKSMSSAIRLLISAKVLPPEDETTAWFLELVNDWFDLMTSCRVCNALSLPNTSMGRAKLERLQEFLVTWTQTRFLSVKSGAVGLWKPSHTGVRMATCTMLVMAGSLLFPSVMVEHLPSVPPSFIPPNPNWVAHMMDTGSLNLSFFLTGRVSTDANENLHAQLRCNNNMHPQAKQCRTRLRLISLAQFEKPGSDDGASLVEYSDHLRSKEEGLREPVEIEEMSDDPVPPLPLVTSQTLYYLTGWAVFKTLRRSSCQTCKDFCLSSNSISTDHSYATTHCDDPSLLTLIHSNGGLKHPSKCMHA